MAEKIWKSFDEWRKSQPAKSIAESLALTPIDYQREAWHARNSEVATLKAELLKAHAACAEMAVMLSIYADSNNFIKGNDWVWNGEDDPTLAAKKALDESNPGLLCSTDCGTRGVSEGDEYVEGGECGGARWMICSQCNARQYPNEASIHDSVCIIGKLEDCRREGAPCRISSPMSS